jgi:uncharacterized protein YjbI with pentapeptide repeats
MAESRTYEGNGHSVTIADPKNITKDECLALARCGKEAWNSWRREFPTWISAKQYICNSVVFSKLDLREESIDFSGFEFGDCAYFIGTKLSEEANFTGANFGREAYFFGAQFGSRTNFEYAQFGDMASFEGALLGNVANFNGAQFGHQASFDGAQFGPRASFEGTQFDSFASFSARSWEMIAWVYGDLINEAQNLAKERDQSPRSFQSITFKNAVFSGSIDFENRDFSSTTDFSGARFGQAPTFHGTKLHQDTTFDDAIFPSAKRGNDSASRAYRTLKLAFAQQQAIREEQRFFKLEMEEEAARETGWRRWLYRAYRELSDFGFSLSRPTWLLLATSFIAALLYAWQAGLTFSLNNTHTAALVQFSIASAIPGLEKLAEPAAIRLFGEVSKGVAAYGLPTVITLLAHKAISLLALFLIGLALRNLFKMK